VFLGIDDGQTNPALPLDEANIRAITHLAAVDKSRLDAHTWYPGDHPKAGWPETYWLRPLDGNTQRPQIIIHESRLIIFGGGRVTHRKRVELQGWGHSTLESVHEILADYNMSWRGLTHMLQSANQDVWKFKGFLAAMASGTAAMKEYFAGRMRMSTMSMGPNRPVILDSDGEGYERHASQFTGVPETIREMCQRVAAACDMPMTILFGMSPAGLNATGESDLQWWYESVTAMQHERLEPKLRRLITLLMLAKEGPTQGRRIENWAIKFKPLKQMTLLEVSTLRKTVAETDHIYITDQVVLPEEIALARHRPEGWSMDTKIDLDARKKILDAELERAIDEAENPPEPPPGQPGAPPPGSTAPPSAGGNPQPRPGARLDAFDPSQARDEHGQWAGDGGGSGSKRAAMRAHIAAKNAAKTPQQHAESRTRAERNRAALATKPAAKVDTPVTEKRPRFARDESETNVAKQAEVDARKEKAREKLGSTEVRSITQVKDVAKQVHASGDPERAFISDVYEAIPNPTWTSLDDFKQFLVKEATAGHVKLSRQDLAAAQPRATQEKSVTRRGSAEFHYIKND
jgi:uncharacterized protein